MKIKLINLPQPNSLDDRLDPPLGLMYIKAFLANRGIDSEIIDLPFIDKNGWKEAIGLADYYGITVYSASLYLAKKVARIAKENNPKGKVIVGGPHPAALCQAVLEGEPDFDIAVLQEGEMTMFELAQGIPECDINGIVYKKNSKLVKNRERALIKDLDSLPLPDRQIMRTNQYTRKVYGKPATSLITSRGCYFNCAFCCKEIFGSEVRFRSIDSVIREIEQLIEEYNIKHYLFYDDTFVLKRERLYPLCDRLSSLGIIFRCNGNARYNTYEDYKILHKAGCREIAFGIESGSQKILDIINKGVTVEQNRKAIIDAKMAGLLVKAYLMVGNPGETRQTIDETMDFIKDSDPDQFTLFTFVPLPGCDIWNNPEKYKIKIVNRDFKEYFNIAGDNDGGLVIETEELTSSDIKELRKNLLHFLRHRGQRGVLQDYYIKL